MTGIPLHAAYLHQIDPYAVRFGEGFGIRWYGLSYLLGFIAAYLLFSLLARRGRTALNVNLVGDFIFAVALGVIFGARLGYCLFYDISLFARFSTAFPFWGIFEIHRGGMSSHGGMIGIIIACFIFSRKHRIAFLHLCDLCVLAGGIGIFFGRIANFVNGELVGRPSRAGLPWAVKFPQDILLWPFESPAQLLKLAPLAEQFGIPAAEWQALALSNPLSGSIEAVLHKILAAIQTGEYTLALSLSPLLTPRHPSQLYEALLEGALVFGVMLWLMPRVRRAGILTAAFFLTYSAARIFAEQFRLPDFNLGYQWLGLTRGQWLSAALIAAGLVLLIFLRRDSTDIAQEAALPPFKKHRHN